MRERGRILLSLSLWCVGFPLPILLSSLPNVHNAIRSIGPKLGHPALQKTEGSDARFSWWETTEGHYTRLRKTSSRISTLNNSRVRLRDCLEASCTAVRRVEQRKLSKHKKAPPPKTIAALFDVIGWCWPQRRKRYWHLSRRDESCQQPIPISRRASLHIRRCLARNRLTRVGGGYSFVCNSFQSRKFGL